MHNLATIQKHLASDLASLLGNRSVEKQPKPAMPYTEPVNPAGHELRILWLRQSGADYTKVNRLYGRCLASGLRLQLFENIDSMTSIEQHRELILHADMVLLEAFGRIGRETHAILLASMRQYSIAPVVILTEDASAERTVSALRAGADAVVLLNMPEDVIVARIYSLLRRWFHPTHAP